MTDITFITRFSDDTEIVEIGSIDAAQDIQIAPGTADRTSGCTLIFNDQVVHVPHVTPDEIKLAFDAARTDTRHQSVPVFPIADFSRLQVRRASASAANHDRIPAALPSFGRK